MTIEDAQRFENMIITNEVENTIDFMAFCGLVSSHYGIGVEHWMNTKVDMDFKRTNRKRIAEMFNNHGYEDSHIFRYLETEKSHKRWNNQRERFEKYIEG